MIQLSKVDVWGFEHAIRGMRNPLNSWQYSDSKYVKFCEMGFEHPNYQKFQIGPSDLDLMHRLYKASINGDNHAHRKYLRQIMVSMDILAPLYFWKEFDTYKIGTTANSTSTMHKITAKEFTLEDFSTDHLMKPSLDLLQYLLDELNRWRDVYLNGGTIYCEEFEKSFNPKDKEVWWQLIQLLPSSYNQLRTVTLNYENVFAIINQRTGHKLDEWNQFVDAMWSLPYVASIREGVSDE